MPNWCANRLCISGSLPDVQQVKALMTGATYPLYREAIQKSIKLFVAGCAGIVKPPRDMACPSYPDLIGHGAGAPDEANRAFGEWLEFFNDDAALTEEHSGRILDCYARTGLPAFEWSHLTPEQQEIVQGIFEKKHFDWSFGGPFAQTAIEQWWQQLDERPTSVPFDMLLLLPTRLASEINGFNGGLLDVSSTYDLYREIYGVKWPVGYSFELLCHTETAEEAFLEVAFDTPWGPPANAVLAALAEQYRCVLTHYYSENGMCFCGRDEYVRGSLFDSLSGELEYGPENEDGISEIVGPGFILGNVTHYGG